MKFRSAAMLAVASLGLSACAVHSWAPPPGVSDPGAFERQTAQCRLFARGATPTPGGFFASGSPRFVGTAMGAYAIGAAIGTAIQTQNNFNDCMAASGWHAAS